MHPFLIARSIKAKFCLLFSWIVRSLQTTVVIIPKLRAHNNFFNHSRFASSFQTIAASFQNCSLISNNCCIIPDLLAHFKQLLHHSRIARSFQTTAASFQNCSLISNNCCIIPELLINFRHIFEDKLPNHFVFVAIYQMTKRKSIWNLFDIKDSSGASHLALEFNGHKRKQSVTLIYKNENRQEQRLEFSRRVGKMVLTCNKQLYYLLIVLCPVPPI